MFKLIVEDKNEGEIREMVREKFSCFYMCTQGKMLHIEIYDDAPLEVNQVCKSICIINDQEYVEVEETNYYKIGQSGRI